MQESGAYIEGPSPPSDVHPLHCWARQVTFQDPPLPSKPSAGEEPPPSSPGTSAGPAPGAEAAGPSSSSPPGAAGAVGGGGEGPPTTASPATPLLVLPPPVGQTELPSCPVRFLGLVGQCFSEGGWGNGSLNPPFLPLEPPVPTCLRADSNRLQVCLERLDENISGVVTTVRVSAQTEPFFATRCLVPPNSQLRRARQLYKLCTMMRRFATTPSTRCASRAGATLRAPCAGTAPSRSALDAPRAGPPTTCGCASFAARLFFNFF